MVKLSREIIFVGGVHGVGKTTFCKNLATKLELSHYSSSNIIRSVKSSAISLKTKVVVDIDKNQDILLHGIEALDIDNKKIILDGHFVLLQNNLIHRLPLPTYKKLGIVEVILLTDSPENIKDRLSARDNNSHFSTGLVAVMQKEEVSYAKEVSRILGVRLNIRNVIVN